MTFSMYEHHSNVQQLSTESPSADDQQQATTQPCGQKLPMGPTGLLMTIGKVDFNGPFY